MSERGPVGRLGCAGDDSVGSFLWNCANSIEAIHKTHWAEAVKFNFTYEILIAISNIEKHYP